MEIWQKSPKILKILSDNKLNLLIIWSEFNVSIDCSSFQSSFRSVGPSCDLACARAHLLFKLKITYKVRSPSEEIVLK